ncbi:PRAME family member 20-like [Octodon degus]|uniref:PRAME family member 20-like n=1 Tax=Octodon degus TaxID=10160 RepID=A0A6P3FWR0_OCTDE|nr:PRAME family member 20-like [Octodon degus]
MSLQSPHVLRNLAIQSLLRDKALAMEAVEHLPGELYPPVFMEAFSRGHTELLQAMVQSWPFPSLPLGDLMSMRDPDTLFTHQHPVRVEERMFHAVLDGLGVLLSHKPCSRSSKLQVLDLRVMNHNFWRVWGENNLEVCCSPGMRSRETEKMGPNEVKKKPIRVLVVLWLSQEWLCPLETYLLKWIQKREDLVQLHCTKLGIRAPCFRRLRKLLSRLSLEPVQELDVGHHWTIFALARFAPFLGQMRNLQRLTLSAIKVPALITPKRREHLFSQITSQFGKLQCLQEIYMNSVQFLEGHLDQALRCLSYPLQTLSLTHCQLSQSDWNQLPHMEQIRKLKHFNLSCIKLSDFSPEPLRILLDHMAPTLTTLHLENCHITHAQLQAILPSLLCCSQLNTFCFIRNYMSTGTMRNLLCHTARLSNLKQELYSVPQEFYVPRHGAHNQMREQVHQDLEWIMRPLHHPRTVYFCTFHCELCCSQKFLKIHPNPCSACIPIK